MSHFPKGLLTLADFPSVTEAMDNTPTYAATPCPGCGAPLRWTEGEGCGLPFCSAGCDAPDE